VALFAPPQYSAAVAYEQGFRDAFRSIGLKSTTKLVIRSSSFQDEDEEEARVLLHGLFRCLIRPRPLPLRPDRGGLLLMPQLGLRVPEDVSLLGSAAPLREGALAKRLSCVVVDEVAAGRRGRSLLHEMRSGERSHRQRRRVRDAVGTERRSNPQPAGGEYATGFIGLRKQTNSYIVRKNMHSNFSIRHPPSKTRFYARGTLGGDPRNHRHLDRAVAAGGAGCTGGGQTHAMRPTT